MLDKAIEHGKEHREPYHDCRSLRKACRNHGSCPRCVSNRTFNDRKNREPADADVSKMKPNTIIEIIE